MMLATVENLCKSQGGIGVMLFDLNKWFKFEYVYAIQVYILLTGILLDISLTKLKYFLFPYSLLSIKK
jgi:NitT/TauT family transport system permease protein